MAVRPIDSVWLKRNLNKVFPRECDQLYGMLQLIDEAPTLTPTTIGHCKDCYNWNEQFSAKRKSLNNYVCYCSQWSDPENGYKRYTSPNDYCSYFEPKEALKDGL